MYRSLPLCGDRQLNNNPLETLLRTSRAVPALTSIFTLATAFHKAWESKCNATRGVCTELRSMTRKEFVSQFLEPIEYIVGDDADHQTRTRSPRASEKLEGNKLALTVYRSDEHKQIDFRQVRCKYLKSVDRYLLSFLSLVRITLLSNYESWTERIRKCFADIILLLLLFRISIWFQTIIHKAGMGWLHT